MLVPIKEFRKEEFACKCGTDCGYGYEDMEEAFLSRLFTARKMSKVGFTLTSAVRCPAHPEAIKKPTSSHNADRGKGLKSKAVDIKVPTSYIAYEVHDSLRAAGFTRIGWNQKLDFMHVDADTNKVQRVLFKY